ncbi:Fc.00g111500.m01.CDS01 [Cosmosporella sp. VM-42]
MKVNVATALAGFVSVAAALKGQSSFAILHFTNTPLVAGRMDPIVSPGKPSSHSHHVMGGSGFGLSSTGKDLANSKCSNALIKGDNSNYWFPSLYFKDPKTGKLEPVEVFYVNAYYFFQDTNDVIKAFPLGMSMVSGNGTTHVVPEAGISANLDPSKGPIGAARWTCPRSSFDPPSWPVGSDGSMAGIGDPNNKGEGVGFPDYNCDGYASPLRADLHFPSCYNPKAGLTNYKENMAFPSDNKGKLDCPAGWTHVPKIFMEVYWNTPKFVDRWEQGKGHQPFVLSSGDATGFSHHGDFMSGWDEALLQHIIDTCDAGEAGMDKCPDLFYGLNSGDCKIDSQVDEKIDGVLDKLPGDNPIKGWSYGDGSTSNAASDGDDNSSSAAAAPSPSTTTKAAEVKPTTKATAGAVTTKTDKPKTTSTVPKASSTKSKAPTVSSKPTTFTSKSKLSKPTEIVNPVIGQSSCKGKTHTVYRTVTVTAPASPAETGGQYAKREARQHVQDHARRHRSFRR